MTFVVMRGGKQMKLMTFREKLTQEYPEIMDYEDFEDAMGCPSFYGYEPETGRCPDEYANCGFDFCCLCWNREMLGGRQDEGL